MRNVSGPAQPSLFTNDACASVRRYRIDPDLLRFMNQQRARVKRQLAAIPDAPNTRRAYAREYEWTETMTTIVNDRGNA